jgi:hypothetical protein
MSRRGVACSCVLGVLAVTARTRAADVAAPQLPSTDSSDRPIEIGAGADAINTFGMTCRRQADDLVACVPGMTWAGMRVAPRWRLSPFFSAGINGAVGWRPSSEGSNGSDGSGSSFSQRLARLSAEGRLHFLGDGATQAFAAFEIGIASAQDRIAYRGPGGVPGPIVDASQSGPFAALGAGFDVYLVPLIALGADARAVAIAFGRDAPVLGSQGQTATVYGTQVGFTLGLNATLRPRF